jgi:hypothetical protein
MPCEPGTKCEQGECVSLFIELKFDIDNDGIEDAVDLCADGSFADDRIDGPPNERGVYKDIDSDNIRDACDTCASKPGVFSDNRVDENQNTVADMCELDIDNDNIPDFKDLCPDGKTFADNRKDGNNDGISDDCVEPEFPLLDYKGGCSNIASISEPTDTTGQSWGDCRSAFKIENEVTKEDGFGQCPGLTGPRYNTRQRYFSCSVSSFDPLNSGVQITRPAVSKFSNPQYPDRDPKPPATCEYTTEFNKGNYCLTGTNNILQLYTCDPGDKSLVDLGSRWFEVDCHDLQAENLGITTTELIAKVRSGEIDSLWRCIDDPDPDIYAICGPP